MRFGCHPQWMKAVGKFGLLLMLLVCGVTVLAQDKGNWRAASNTAQSITGDIGITADKLFINFAGFTMAEIRTLSPTELAGVFEAQSGAPGTGNLYRLNVPADKKFLHKNTLCGSEQTQWMATYVEGRTLHVAFFSGQKLPVMTAEALANSTDLCGTFLYVR
jgi:hypothetical protein